MTLGATQGPYPGLSVLETANSPPIGQFGKYPEMSKIEHRSFIIPAVVAESLEANNLAIGHLAVACEAVSAKLGWSDGVNKLTSFSVGKTTISGRSGRQDKGVAELKAFTIPERTLASFVEFSIKVEKLAKKYEFTITLPTEFDEFKESYPFKAPEPTEPTTEPAEEPMGELMEEPVVAASELHDPATTEASLKEIHLDKLKIDPELVENDKTRGYIS